MQKSLAGLALGLAALVGYPAVAGAQTHQDTDLRAGQSVSSESGRYQLVHQGDGNVVLYDDQGKPLWHTETAGTTTDRLVFQDDGNLVLYGTDGTAVWHAGTHGEGETFAVQDDANVVVYGDDGNAVWTRHGLASSAPTQARAMQVSTVWDRLAQCESGGNWHTNTGNGYSGGLQWSQGSWNSFKDAGAPYSAAAASREQEIAAAERYRAYEQSAGRGGYGPWPHCARQLGLPR